MSEESANLLAEDYQKLIRSVVHKKMRSHCVLKPHWSYVESDLLAEAAIIFMQAKESHKDDGGRVFSSWLYQQLEYRIGNFIKRKLYRYTSEGAQQYVELEETHINHLVEYIDNIENIIDEDRGELIHSLYKEAYTRWKIEKAAYLFFVYALDETEQYNPYGYSLVSENLNYFEGLTGQNLNWLTKSNFKEFILFFHQLLSNLYEGKEADRYKISNNIRKSIDYFLKEKRGYANG